MNTGLEFKSGLAEAIVGSGLTFFFFFLSPPMAGGFRKCRDGRLPLDGFILADGIMGLSISEKKYDPPVIPEDWKALDVGLRVEAFAASAVETYFD
jgi:hypothetical protein